jgi:hypothetical protein
VPNLGTKTTTETKKGNFQLAAFVLKITASPNPSTSFFTIRMSSKSQVAVDPGLVDAVGRVVEHYEGVASTSNSTMGRTLRLGTYYLEAVQR